MGKATWYKIQFIYNGIKQLNSLDSEGLNLSEVSRQFPEMLAEGSSGDFVRIIQLLLDYVSVYEETVPAIPVSGYYGPETTEAVRAFQSTYGLTPDGIMGDETYSVLYDVYEAIIASIPPEIIAETAQPYPGVELQLGDEGGDVRTIQEYLNYLSETYPEIPYVTPTGVFSSDTLSQVIAFQELFGITPSGIIGVLTWSLIAELYTELRLGNIVAPGQFPGFDIG